MCVCKQHTERKVGRSRHKNEADAVQTLYLLPISNRSGTGTDGWRRGRKRGGIPKRQYHSQVGVFAPLSMLAELPSVIAPK